jgi:hypothetical protein
MKRQKVATIGLVAGLAIVLGGCGFFTKTGLEPQDRALQSQAISGGPIRTIDDLFAEVARRVPAFGGMFLSEDERTLYVYLTDLRSPVVAAAQAAIAAVFGAQRIPQDGIREIQGQYGFLQLKEWYDRMWPSVLAIPGVALTDINDMKNRLTIGLERMNEEILNPVKQALQKLGIPHEAVNFEEIGPIKFATTLRDRVRPVVGGLLLRSEKICTLGFNAIRAGFNGFVTASHCTNVQGGVESTVFYQTTITESNRIGIETADPLYQQFPACPSGRWCRYSDSAFARYDSGVSFSQGYTARTTGLGSITVDPTYPTFRIVAKTNSIILGESPINKIGQRTGWTQGPITAVCQNVNVSLTNITLLCQNRVRANVEGGDSGSPVFKITNSPTSGDVMLYGILWGRSGTGWPWDPVQFWFSSIFDVESSYSELGPLSVCAPGFSC